MGERVWGVCWGSRCEGCVGRLEAAGGRGRVGGEVAGTGGYRGCSGGVGSAVECMVGCGARVGVVAV